MNRRRLLVLDGYDVGALRRATEDGDRWDVLLLRGSEAWFRWQAAAAECEGDTVHFLDPKALAPGAHERVRTFVFDAVEPLDARPVGRRSLAAALEGELKTSWWFTETSELGPYRTPLVFQLYDLAMIDEAMAAQRYETIIVATSASWLAGAVKTAAAGGAVFQVAASGAAAGDGRRPSRAVRYWRSALGAIFSLVTIRAAAAAWRRPGVRPRTPAVFTFYPAWWRDPLGSGADERFFSDPPEDGWFLCWLHDPLWVWRHRRAIGSMVERRRGVVLQRYVRLREALALCSPVRFARTLRLVAELPNGPRLRFGSFDATALVVRDLERSLLGGERFQDELVAAAVARAAARLQPAWIVYRAEFQPSERAVVLGARGRTSTAGFLHYPFGRNYLPGWGRRQPRPDAMLSCGEIGRAHAAEAGWPRERIALCGPQRHAGLVKRLAAPRDRASLRRLCGAEAARPLLVVAPAIVQADTEALFGALYAALDGFGPYRLAVRTHPNRPCGDAALATALGVFELAEVPQHVSLYDLLDAADALVTIGSTLAFEAMALGCMPIVFENPSTYAATSLSDFEDALYVARDAAQLRAALDEIRGNAPGARRRRAGWTDAIRRTLGDTSTPLAGQMTRALAGLPLRAAG
ncbi:MAG: hypothetical protein IT176_14665 [Acidobacteria bacterium]|nr:hypothetical protein [Acidobacteriota bacterium]